MRGKGEGQPRGRCQPRAEVAGAEQRDGHTAIAPWNGFDHLTLLFRAEVRAQLVEQLGKIVAALAQVTAQRAHGHKVAARRAAQAKVDAARIDCLKRAELLGHHQRRVVGQHDAAAAYANGVRSRSHVTNQNGCRGTGQAFNRVVLGKPEAAIAPLLGVLRKVHRARNTGSGGLARMQADKIEHGDRKTHTSLDVRQAHAMHAATRSG